MTQKKQQEPKDWSALAPEAEQDAEIQVDIAADKPEPEAQPNAAEAKINEYKEMALRCQAELDNLRRRSEQQVAQAHKYALERFAQEIVTVADNLERSLAQKGADDIAAVYTGVELTLQGLQKILEKFAIKSIDPLDQAFDPALHEAMSTQEQADKAPGTVLAVLQKGYVLNDRLVRPALVIVAKAAEKN